MTIASVAPPSLLPSLTPRHFFAEVAGCFYLLSKGANVDWSFDPSHWLSNASKGALRTTSPAQRL